MAFMTEEVKAKLEDLRELAERKDRLIPLETVINACNRKQVIITDNTKGIVCPFPLDQTIDLPLGVKVTLTVEEQTYGKLRHMSISSPAGTVVSAEIIKVVMEPLGFSRPVSSDRCWSEFYTNGRVAINIFEDIYQHHSEDTSNEDINIGTPFIMDDHAKKAIEDLRTLAERKDRIITLETLKACAIDPKTNLTRPYTPDDQTLCLSLGWVITFSLEYQPKGLSRHVSISCPIEGNIPAPEVAMLIMDALGFTGPLQENYVYQEEYKKGWFAINILELVKLEN